MDLFSGMFAGFSALADPVLVLFFLLGTVNGLIFGLLPGLSGSVGIALMIPLTYGLELNQALALFVAAMSGQTFAGSIGAILINVPGTAPNAATTFDGYPLTRQGRGGFAIGISAMSSAMGSVIGCLILVLTFPVIRAAVLQFSFPEFTLLGLVGLVAIAMASRGTLLKGLASGAFGLLIAMVGFAPIGNELRYIFGFRLLWDGVNLIPVLIGLFAVGEVMRLVLRREAIAKGDAAGPVNRSQTFEGMRFVLARPGLLIRSAVLGTFLGIVPGVGGTVASFLAYFQAKKTSRDGKFGEGDPRGVMAPETANDAKDAGSALPSLGFGIPGSSDWAIILGAMILHGVAPGPTLITENPEVVWITIVVILLASWTTSIAGIIAAPWLVRLTSLRGTMIGPIVAALAITGAFAVQQRVLDVFYVVIAGVVGYYMTQNQVPVVPLILGLLLGDDVESWFLRTMSLFDNDWSVFVTRPISLGLILVLVALLVSEVLSWRKRSKEAAAEIGKRVDYEIHFNPSGTLLLALWGILAVAALVLAGDFNEPADQFPIISGSLLAITCAVYVLITTVPVLRRRFWPVAAEAASFDILDAATREKVPDPAGAATGSAGEDAADRDTDSVGSGGSHGSSSDGAGGDGGEVVGARGDGHDAGSDESVVLVQSEGIERKREIAVAALFLGVAFGIWVVGLWLTMPVFIWLLMRVFGGESARVAVISVVATMIVFYIGLVQLLGMRIGFGMIG